MFFPLSKILGFFAIPSNLVVSIGILGLLLLPTRFARAGRALAFASLIVLAILGLSPVGNALIIPLEERFPRWDATRGAPIYDEGAEAPLALRLLESFGIPRASITLEDRSRNTVENAVLSKAIAQPKPGERWLLVTSAHHLPRAVGVFRKAGFPVEAYPVDWRTRGADDALRPFASVGDGLRRGDTAVREWVGLAVYWLTGRSSELFPGPRMTVIETRQRD